MDPSVQQFLRRLDGLPGGGAEIAGGIRQAISIAESDPEMALTRLRKVLEFVLRDVFVRRCGEDPGTRPLENVLQRLLKDGHLPDRLAAYANTIRMLGNVGTHKFNQNVTRRDVDQSLLQLLPIVEWYLEPELRDGAPPQPPVPADDPATPAVEGVTSGPLQDAPPRSLPTIGGFELISILGEGAQSVVYRARQPAVEREVALKCLRSVGDRVAETRFLRQIKALGQVDHPHIERVFASGVEGDHWFFATELLAGSCLACIWEKVSRSASVTSTAVDWPSAVATACAETRRQEKPLNSPTASGEPLQVEREKPSPVSLASGRCNTSKEYVRDVVEIIRQIATAAHTLHEAGIIHRDIKPANIMVSPDGKKAVLMDLGVARVSSAAVAEMTGFRHFVGTLPYSSPEQSFSADSADARSDVYSLGATLWELLTLRPLLGAQTGISERELIRRIQFAAPEPIRRFNRSVTRDLQAVVLKCLRKDPDERYQSAAELANELTRCLTGHPRPSRLRRLIPVAVSALLIGAIAFATYRVFTGDAHKETLPAARGTSNDEATRGGASTQLAEAADRSSAEPADDKVKVRIQDLEALRSVEPVRKKYAVLIGVNQYKDGPIDSLKFSVNDSVEMYKSLTQACDYEADDVVLLNDDGGIATSPEEKSRFLPTKANFVRSIEELSTKVLPEDLLLFYFSGHAFLVHDGEGALAMQDTQYSKLGETGLLMSELRRLLGKVARRNILVLDCSSSSSQKGAGRPVEEPRPAEEHASKTDFVVLCGCAGNEASYESNELKQSVFSYFLVQGLKGDADRESTHPDGLIEPHELHSYVSSRVRSYVDKKHGQRQTPILYYSPEVTHSFEMARLRTTGAPLAVDSVARAEVLAKDLDSLPEALAAPFVAVPKTPYAIQIVQVDRGQTVAVPIDASNSNLSVRLRPGQLFAVEVFNGSESEARVNVYEVKYLNKDAFDNKAATNHLLPPKSISRIPGWNVNNIAPVEERFADAIRIRFASTGRTAADLKDLVKMQQAVEGLTDDIAKYLNSEPGANKSVIVEGVGGPSGIINWEIKRLLGQNLRSKGFRIVSGGAFSVDGRVRFNPMPGGETNGRIDIRIFDPLGEEKHQLAAVFACNRVPPEPVTGTDSQMSIQYHVSAPSLP